MSFFILTGAILLGTIFIVHFAANAVGFRLFYTSLFLSAIFALSINLIVISMKEVTSPLSLAKILLTVLFASALVTTVNELLVMREKKKLQKKRSGRKENARKKAFEDTLDNVAAEEVIKEADNDKIDNIEIENEDLKDKIPEKENFFKRLLKRLSFRKTQNEKAETVEDKVSAEEEISNKAENIDDVFDETPKITEETSFDDSNKDEEVKEVESESPPKESFIKKIFKKEEKPKREKLDLSKFQDLDALLDYAYEAKISGDYVGAVEAYEGAIEKYDNDPYLPFLFIDLGNVHKAQGEYNAAIDIYEKALNMPGIEKDSSIVKSFEENINYLKALKIVLRKHKAEHKPFAEIDEDILKEVEQSLNNQ